MNDNDDSSIPLSARVPTLTGYQRLANGVHEALDAMMEGVPRLDPKERRSSSFVRTHIGISRDFVFTTAKGVERISQLERMEQMNLAAAYAARQLAEAFRPVINRLIDVAEELQTLIDTREANAASEALRMYGLVKALAGHRKADPALHSLLKDMKRDLGRRGPARKKAAGPKPRKSRRIRMRQYLGARLRRRKREED